MMKIFSIHDGKAQFYGNPWYARTKMEAQRSFADIINDDAPNNLMAKHHSDYTLFELGDFDEQTGKIVLLDAPLPLGNGVDYKQQ